jgi:hypothetical protein
MNAAIADLVARIGQIRRKPWTDLNGDGQRDRLKLRIVWMYGQGHTGNKPLKSWVFAGRGSK